MKTFKKNNKGFSLVELIVVIAIMAVLGVAIALAVTKFIPQSQRSTDISNANMIAEACEVAVNDFATTSETKDNEPAINGVKKSQVFTSTTVDVAKLVETGLLKSEPKVQGANYKDGTTEVQLDTKFTVYYNEKTGKVNCYIGKTAKTIDLCNTTTAKEYKDGKAITAAAGE